MERITSINPERILWCCADLGITSDQLANEAGVAAATMTAVLSGENGFSFNQLQRIADYCGRGILFFLEQTPVDMSHAHTTVFRTLANQKPELSVKLKALIERVERQRAIYISLREDLEESPSKAFSPPVLPKNKPKDAAVIVRKWLDLKSKNTFDSYRAALERQGILVFRSNGYNGKWQIAKESPVLGFTLYDPLYPVIVIKKQASDSQQSFTLMHELGHLLLHKASSIDDERDMQSYMGKEREANAFAGHLLVPDSVLSEIDDKLRPTDVVQFDEWLSSERKAFGVSGEVILRRLLDNERLPQNLYASYRKWRAQLVFSSSEGGARHRHREPKHIFGDPFVRTVLDSLNSRHITLAKASTYLDGLKINDLHQLERHYADA